MKKICAFFCLPYLVGFLGALMNQLVLATNGGKFPVMGMDDSFPADRVHVLMTSASHLRWLADWIVLAQGTVIASPGDLLLMAAIWMIEASPVLWLLFALYLVYQRNQNGTVSSLPRPL